MYIFFCFLAIGKDVLRRIQQVLTAKEKADESVLKLRTRVHQKIPLRG